MLKRLFAGLFILLLLTAAACAEPQYIPEGHVINATGCNLALVLPPEFKYTGSSDLFYMGYSSPDMTIGFTPMAPGRIEELQGSRFPEGFSSREEIAIGGFQAEWLTPNPASEAKSVLLVRADEEHDPMEFSFIMEEEDADVRRDMIVSVMEQLRRRTDTIEKDYYEEQKPRLFEHKTIGLNLTLPSSFVRMPEERLEDGEIAVYQNDYVLLSLYGYKATIEEYIEQYGMSMLDFTLTESEVHGVKFYVFETKEVFETMPIAFCVAEGKDGHLLEMVFLAADPYTEVDQNWFYVSSICSSLGMIP